MNPDRRDASSRRKAREPHRRDAVDEVPSIESGVLLGHDGRVRIRHRGQTYELRETRFGKLILTK